MRIDWRKLLLRLALGAGALVLLLLIAGWVLTAIYGPTIKQRTLAEANARLKATLNFDAVEISFFRYFPAPTVSLTDLSLIGRDRFAGDTLVAFGRADLSVNLFSLIGSEGIEVTGLDLDRLVVRALVLPDGAANWDIVVPDTATPKPGAEGGSAFRLRLASYRADRASIHYRDQTFPIDLRVDGVTHSGSGDLTATVIELVTKSQIGHISLTYGGVRYLHGQRVTGNVGLGIDLSDPAAMKVSLRNSTARLNELSLSLDGTITLRKDDMPLDLRFALGESNLKGLLSLVPALYQNQFEKLDASGIVALQGSVKGVYSATTIPGFDLALQVADGNFGYQGLPAKVTGLGMDLAISNPTGVIDRTVIDLKRLTAAIAGQPLEARLRVEGLRRPRLDGAVKAALDLAVIPQVYPLPDYQLAGKFAADASFSGVLDSTTFPTAKGYVSLTDGRIVAKQIPVPLEGITAKLFVENSSPDGKNLVLRLDPFSLTLGGNAFTARALISGLADPAYDIAVKGSLDLALIDSLFPEAGRRLTGTFAGELATAGRVSDVQKKHYDRLTGSGAASLTGFTFASSASPVSVSIPLARMSLSPSAITLAEFRSQLGRSDLSLDGAIYDAVPYLLGKGALRGTLTARSKQLDLNEFLAGAAPAPKSKADTTAAPLKAPILPKEVDLVFTASADEVKYTQLSMREFTGIITLRDQVLRLVDCRFAAAGGKFSATAAYDTRRPAQPHSSLAMKIESLDIAQAVAQLPIIPQLAPIALFTQGSLNSDFSLSTDLKPNLMPDLGTLSMAGSFEALKAAIKGFPVTQALANSGKMSFLDNLSIERAAFKAGFTNGRLQVQPFTFPVAGQKVTVSGSNGLDQSLDYRVGVEVPSAQLAAVSGAAQGLLGKLGISQLPATVTLNFGVGGTATKPIISPLAPSLGSGGTAEGGAATSVSGAVKQQLTDTLGKARANAEAKLQAEKERRLQEVQQKAAAETERLNQDAQKAKADAERRAKEELDRKKKEAEDKLKKLNPFKKN